MCASALALVLVLAACRSTAERPARPAGGVSIGIGDELAVTVEGHPDLSLHFRVPMAGRIAFPLIGDLELEDRSPEDVSRDLQGRLAVEGIANPCVRVAVTARATQFVYVLGGVSRPGVVKVPEPDILTIAQAVKHCGGFTPESVTRRIRVIRRRGADTTPEVIKADRGADAPDGVWEDLKLRGGDIVVVPEVED